MINKKFGRKITNRPTVEMKCSYCSIRVRYSPLRLGRKCGHCKKGKYIPVKVNHPSLTEGVSTA